MRNEKSYQLLQNIKLHTLFPGRTRACSSAVPAMKPATSPATLGFESKVSFSSFLLKAVVGTPLQGLERAPT